MVCCNEVEEPSKDRNWGISIDTEAFSGCQQIQKNKILWKYKDYNNEKYNISHSCFEDFTLLCSMCWNSLYLWCAKGVTLEDVIVLKNGAIVPNGLAKCVPSIGVNPPCNFQPCLDTYRRKTCPGLHVAARIVKFARGNGNLAGQKIIDLEIFRKIGKIHIWLSTWWTT